MFNRYSLEDEILSCLSDKNVHTTRALFTRMQQACIEAFEGKKELIGGLVLAVRLNFLTEARVLRCLRRLQAKHMVMSYQGNHHAWILTYYGRGKVQIRYEDRKQREETLAAA